MFRYVSCSALVPVYNIAIRVTQCARITLPTVACSIVLAIGIAMILLGMYSSAIAASFLSLPNVLTL